MPRHAVVLVIIIVILPQRGLGASPPIEIVPPLSHAHQWFGYAVASSGDDLAVGAPRHDGRAESSGAVFLFQHRVGGWAMTERLTPPRAGVNGFFGRAVAMREGWLVVGAPGAAPWGRALPWAGAVEVYRRSTRGWAHCVTLTNPDADPGRGVGSGWAFGEVVGLRVDGEDVTVVVGAPDAPFDGLERAGAAYVYRWGGRAWDSEGRLAPSRPGALDRFGRAVSFAGAHLVVGAPSEPDTETPGAAWLFAPRCGAWEPLRTLVSPAAAPGDGFGQGLGAMAGLMAVGAPGLDDARGAVAVLARGGALEVIMPRQRTRGARFGARVVAARTIDGARLYVAASDVGPGRVHGFRHGREAWIELESVSLADGVDGDRFGRSLAIGGGRLAVGAPFREVDDLDDAGAVYLYPDTPGP